MMSDTDRHGPARTGTGAAARPARRDAGFTLMELLIVIAIMAIISTAAVGGYFGMMRAAAYSAAHDNVYNTLMLAKQRAVIDGKITSLMILNATNYVVVRAVGRISRVDTVGGVSGVAQDAYSDLSGAVSSSGKRVELYNLDGTAAGGSLSRSVLIKEDVLLIRDWTVPDSEPDWNKKNYNVSGYIFEGAGAGFFAEGDRYGFALHAVQALPRGYLFTGALPREVRFNVDGSRIKPDSAPLEPITIEETIRKVNKIAFEISASGTVTDNSTVVKQ